MSNKEQSHFTDPDNGVFYGRYKGVYIPKFCRDLTLFGASNVVEICNAFGVDDKTFAEIVKLPLFKKEMREIKAIAEASPNSLIQMKAREVVDEGLDAMRDIIKHGQDKERIKAMELLAKISGVYETGRLNSSADENKASASGLTLNVNLGPGGLIPPLPEGEPRPLRRVKEIAEVIDVE